jgi:beta-glucosidase
MRSWIRPAAATSLAALLVAPSVFPAAGEKAKSFSAYDAKVLPLLAKMTLDEKVGQMTQPDQLFIKDRSDIETLSLGSVLSGGNSDPKTNSFDDWREMYESIQAHSQKTRLKIPLLYGVDAVHGHSNVIGATLFPHNIGLGATRDAKLVEEIARITAKEVRATGINWTFAPCVTVPRDERWGRTYEGFSEDPALVAVLGEAATKGLQGDLKDPLRVLGCVKHYVGDGGTVYGTGRKQQNGKNLPNDQGDVQLSEAELRRIHLPGYITSIAAGAGTIMPSYSSWNGVKCSASKRLLTEILKDELGFEGFLISDYNALDDIPGDVRTRIKTSINAGMDMVMVPERYKEFITNLKDLAEKGEVPMSRIDDAVKRILRVKAAMGLLDPDPPLTADRALAASFGSTEHREVARRAVRQSLVLLKNEKKALPLAKNAKRIHVVGRGADDIGNQSGGWTITWQGQSGAVTEGTTILAALKSAAKTVNFTFAKDGTGGEGADAIVAVIGETPYAEGMGDREDLGLAAEDVATVANAKKAGVPVIVVLLSGRPMILGDVLAQADALVAAWLPGTEGQGVADVLLGDYKPTGKLPFTWPRSMAQLPINVGDKTYDPLFAYGYGLTY